MTKVVGIDLGTTYCAIATLDDRGQPVTLPNRDGEMLTPSAVLLMDGGIAVVGQAPALSGFLSARENVELGLALRGVGGDEAAGRATETLAAVDLAAHADRRLELLSAGQRERVALTRAFAACTPVVIADEPTSRLDAVTTLEIGALFAELAHETGTTVVCATHDPLLIGLADRELRLNEAVPVEST